MSELLRSVSRRPRAPIRTGRERTWPPTDSPVPLQHHLRAGGPCGQPTTEGRAMQFGFWTSRARALLADALAYSQHVMALVSERTHLEALPVPDEPLRGDFRGNLIEMKLHGFGVAGRQHQGGAGAPAGCNRTEHIGRLGALIMDRSRT